MIVEPFSTVNRDGLKIGPQVRSETTIAAAIAGYCLDNNCDAARIQGADNGENTEQGTARMVDSDSGTDDSGSSGESISGGSDGGGDES